MENNTPQEIWNKIKESKRILMTLHAMPDGDSIASCTAFKRIIEQNTDAQITLVSHDPIDKAIGNLPLAKEVEFGKDITDLPLENFDLFLTLDTSETSRLGKFKPDFTLPKNLFTINIDHHHTNSYFGNFNYVLSNLPSCCSILLPFFEELKIPIDKETATRLLLGICTDSAFFTNSGAEQALKDAAKLLEKEAEYYKKIVLPVNLEQSLNQKKFYARLILNVKIDKEKKLAYTSLAEKDISDLNLNAAEIRLGIKELQSISDTDFCFTLIELPDGVKGSFRAKEDIDVSLFAKALGGGGHKAAAAFILPKMPIEQAEKQVLEAIDKVGIHKTQ